ncbi:MAG: hypothetical protein JWO45_710 [Spartobacteria bacterium]|nr:hypothetical protein [Spartobacteria bacterium]
MKTVSTFPRGCEHSLFALHFRMAQEKTKLRVGGSTISVSHLDKFLYPAAQFTKAEVIKFYSDISKYIARRRR